MKKAFTLIELLIVVAIIAILAAIAVPNFLEAQVRAKVSRAKADMRSIATGLEAYHVDNNSYPDLSAIFGGIFVTTPVAYLTSIPEDVFRQQLNGLAFPFNVRWYRYGSMPIEGPSRFALESMGPDIDMDVYQDSGGGFDPTITALAFYPGYSPELFTEEGATLPPPATAIIKYTLYDPTNGTVSSGDIFRLSDHQFGS